MYQLYSRVAFCCLRTYFDPDNLANRLIDYFHLRHTRSRKNMKILLKVFTNKDIFNKDISFVQTKNKHGLID